MDTPNAFEGRIASLERSLRRARLTALFLGIGAVVVAAAALTPDAQEVPIPEQVVTQKLALTNELGAEQVVLMAGTDGSLVVLTPAGQEIMRLGGDPARRIGH